VGFAWDVTGKGTTVVRGGASVIYSSFVLLTFTGEFALQNDGSTSIAAVPTAATLQTAGCQGLANACAPVATTPGTISLQAVNLSPTQFNWDSKPGLNGGKAFPTGVSAVCGDGIGVDAAQCDIMGVDPNLRDPYITNWNLSLQHAFMTNLSLEVGYVGNRGSRLIGFRDINQSSLGAGWCQNTTLTAAQLADACGVNNTPGAFNGQAVQEARPFFKSFPYLGFVNWAANTSHSNFNSLQATLTQRTSHGLSFIAGYTYGHGLDNGSLNRFGLLPQDSTKTGAEYGNSDFDIRHRLTLTTTYNIPGVKGFGQLLEGWQVNSIINIQSSQPWTIFDSNFNFEGTGENTNRWNLFGSPDGFKSGASSLTYCAGPGAGGPGNGGCGVTSGVYGTTSCGSTPGNCSATQATALWAKCTAAAPDANTLNVGGCYVTNSGVLVPPALNHFGTLGRNVFRDSAFKNWDLSVFKNFTFKERYGAQFRVEVFNILNHPNIANPYGASNFGGIGNVLGAPSSFGCGCGTPDVIAGNILIGSGSNRVMQLGLKLKF
jgi:hypothetical protein